MTTPEAEEYVRARMDLGVQKHRASVEKGKANAACEEYRDALDALRAAEKREVHAMAVLFAKSRGIPTD